MIWLSGNTVVRNLGRAADAFLIFAIRVYQRIVSPFLPPTCRFNPTCSAYSIEAIRRYGFPRGLYMSLRRILRCHPFHPGGYDPVK